MGQRLEDDTIITGTACSGCDNVLWEPGKTPKYVYAHFSQMERCPGVDWDVVELPPNNRVFRLEQIDGTPCWWRYREPLGWEVNWYVCLGVPKISKVTLGHWVGGTYFQGIGAFPNYCNSSFENTNVCGGLFPAHKGFAWIEWKEIAIALADKHGITLAPTLFYEVFQIDLTTIVYKLTDIERSINVKSKLVPPWCL